MSKKPGKQDKLRTTAETQFSRHTPVMTAPLRSAEELPELLAEELPALAKLVKHGQKMEVMGRH